MTCIDAAAGQAARRGDALRAFAGVFSTLGRACSRAGAVLLLAAAALPAHAQETRIAVVGLLHSHVWGHLEKIIEGKAAKLAGIAESNPDLIAEAKKMGAPDALIFADWKKMLDRQKPDIVWAFIENNRHLEIVEACAPRKIHVMFEKPLASTFNDALRIRELARKHSILVLTNYQMAWWASNYTAKAQVDAGALGKPWRLRGVVGHGGPGSSGVRHQYFFAWLTDPVRNGGGALVDFGCYNALWSLWMIGRPETVYAQTHQLRPAIFPKVEDTAAMLLRYKDAVGIFESSWSLPRPLQDLEIFGIDGSLYVNRNGVELRKGGEAAVTVAGGPLAPEDSDPVAHMVRAIRGVKPLGPLVGIDINVDVVEILEAARMSARTGQPVSLPLPGR